MARHHTDVPSPSFRHLVDASPVMTWTWDVDGHVTYANRRLLEYTGLAGDDDLEKWPARTVHPDDLARHSEAWSKASAAGETFEVEVRIRRHDGAYRWFLARAEPMKDDAGRVLEWFGSATDIDERKCSEDNLRFLADASVALGEVTDVDNTLQRIAHLAVPYFADWSEVTMKDPAGGLRRLAVKHWDPDKMRHIEEVERRYPRDESSGAVQVMKTGEAIWAPEVTDEQLQAASRDAEHLEMLRKFGIKSYLCVPIRGKAGIRGALAFATAESGRVYSRFDLQVAEELARRACVALENAELLEALRDADRRKDEFLAVLAHELRNPLAPVRNAIEILRSVDSPSPQLKWTHDVIDRQVRQLARLVDDLLDVSRITSGKIELRKDRIELAAAARMAVEASRPAIDRARHELTVRIPEEPIILEADIARLAQVISNLLNNAAKFTPPGGHIWLVAEQRDAHAVIRVCDNGIGVEQRMLKKIFDMFTQGGSPADRSQGGLGIGLTLVRRLVEMHGGTIEAKSDGLGMGSEFVIQLPARPARTPAISRPPEERSAAPGAKRRILVVDDNTDAADSLKMLLASRGHDVQVAYDGVEAVSAAAAYEPDVVLMDIGLPRLHGYDACRRIRDVRGKDLLMIAVTGWGQEDDRRRSREAGFDFHLTKPVDPEAISRLIDESGRLAH